MDGSSTCPGEKGLSITLGDCFDSSYLRGKKMHLFTPKSRFQTVFIMKTDHLALKNIPCLKKAVHSDHRATLFQRKSDRALRH